MAVAVPVAGEAVPETERRWIPAVVASRGPETEVERDGERTEGDCDCECWRLANWGLRLRTVTGGLKSDLSGTEAARDSR